jgi:hypothetical protein
VTPPYIPVVKNEDDTSNFDEKFQELEVTESLVSPIKV